MVAVQDSAGRGTSFQEDLTPILPQKTGHNIISDGDVKVWQ